MKHIRPSEPRAQASAAASPLGASPSAADHAITAVAERILAPLAQVRRRARLYLALDGLARLGVVVVIACAAQLVLDYSLRLPVDQRAALNIVITLIWLAVIHRSLMRPLLAPLSDSLLAAAVDRTHPELQGRIATAVQFASGRAGPSASNSPQLVRAVLADACASVDRVRFERALNRARAQRRLREIALLAAGVVAVWMFQPRLVHTWFQRNWLVQELPWPQRTYIIPVGFDAAGTRSAPRGDELAIEALIEGETPNAVTLTWRTPSGRRGRETMTVIGRSRAEISLGVLTEPLTFLISGGDERTREFTVTPVDRPQVIYTAATITPPTYTGLAAATLEQQTVLEMLDGSTLEIAAVVNKPIHSATLVDAEGSTWEVERTASDRLRIVKDAPASGVYQLHLLDLDGYTDRQPLRFTLKVTPDAPPVVQLQLRDAGEFITPAAEIVTEITARDAYGVQDVTLSVQRNEDPPYESRPQEFAPPQREFHGESLLRPADVSARPGDRLRVQVLAADYDPRGPNIGRSDAADLTVLTAGDFLAALAARESELRREFERLIREQRTLRDNLDRLLPTLPAGGERSTAAIQRLSGLARQQEALGGRVGTVRRGFEQILAEMYTNKVVRTADERRLTDRVVLPLQAVVDETIPTAARHVSELRREVTMAGIDRVAQSQADLLRRMEAILENMLELEGFREVVAMLQEIIGLQADLHGETARALERELEAILGLDEFEEWAAPPREP